MCYQNRCKPQVTVHVTCIRVMCYPHALVLSSPQMEYAILREACRLQGNIAALLSRLMIRAPLRRKDGYL